jgi:hypothetical protein
VDFQGLSEEYTMPVRLSPAIAIMAASAWLLIFLGWIFLIRKRWLGRSAQAAAGPDPETLLQGMILIALAPAISVIHYLASGGEAFWGGGVIALTGVALMAPRLLRKQHLPAAERYQQTTYREKSVLAQFAGVLLVFGIFGVRLWKQPLSPGSTTRALMAVAVLVIIVNVIAHIAIRIYANPERPDERDLAVARRGARNAYYVLGFGVWGILMFATAPAFQPHLFYFLLGTLACAEVARLGSQLLYYRVGT